MQHIEKHFTKPEEVNMMNLKVNMGLYEWEQTVADRFISANNKVLNIGCGCGREAIKLAEMGCNVVAIDLSQEMINQAQNNADEAGCKITFIKTDGISLPGENYDSVIIWGQVIGGLDTIEDQLNLLNECKRVLKPNGIISVSGHEKEACINTTPRSLIDDQYLYPWGKSGLKHHLYTMPSFEELFVKTGFDILFAEQPTSLPVIIHIVAKKE